MRYPCATDGEHSGFNSGRLGTLGRTSWASEACPSADVVRHLRFALGGGADSPAAGLGTGPAFTRRDESALLFAPREVSGSSFRPLGGEVIGELRGSEAERTMLNMFRTVESEQNPLSARQ